MRTKFNGILTLFLALIVQISFAQERTISGTVSDESGPLPGVTILKKGTTQGTETDFDGNYSIQAKTGDILVFSFVGMKSTERTVGTSNQITVVLEGDNILDEVVVVAYGTQSKKSITGSVTTVKSEVLEKTNVASLDQALQGSAPGIQVSATSGQPGAATNVRIRGIGSINASSAPLYVVDGVPILTGDLSRLQTTSNILSSINTNDIESISVLKDASSASLYGSRAANGVILITTKAGKAGKTKFTVSSEYGIGDETLYDDNAMTSAQLKQYTIAALDNAFGAGSGEGIYNTGLPWAWDGVTDTNWYKETHRDKTTSQKINFSANGGNEKTTFYSSLGYFEQEGLIKTSDLTRVSTALNLKHKATDKLSIRFNINASHSKLNGPDDGGSFANPELASYFLLPNYPVYNEDGTYNLSFFSTYNPVALFERNFTTLKTTKVFGKTDITYEIIDNLEFNSSFGAEYIALEEEQYYNPDFGAGRNVNGSASAYYTRRYNYNWINQLNYSFDINDDNNFKLKLGYEIQQDDRYQINASGENYATDKLTNLQLTSKPTEASSFGTRNSFLSVFSRVDYNFKNKYFFDFSFRRDGSSKFGSNNRYGNFWAAGFAWSISDEAFFGDNFINSLKLRTSYGVNGNSAGIGNFDGLGLYGFGDYNGQGTSFPNQVANPDLRWELNKPFNVGLDFGMFNSRITGTLEYYKRTTSDLLLDKPLSTTSGFTVITENIGEMENSGIEVNLNTSNIQTDKFSWDTNFNFSTNKNEITKLDEGKDILNGTQIRRVGEHARSWYIRKWAGVNPDNGEPQWYINGKDGAVTSDYNEAERAVQGQSVPEIIASMTNTFKYNNFDLSFQLNYSGNYQVYDGWAFYTYNAGEFLSFNKNSNVLDYWQQPGDITDTPKPVWGNGRDATSSSTRFLYDGDHIRLRNIQFGYSVPEEYLSKAGISGLRLYLTGTNLLTYTFDDKLNFDPEVGITGQSDLRQANLKTYSLGVNLTF